MLRVSDGFFLDCVRAVGQRYPQVQYEERIIDAMAALLVRDASRFDVIVTTNMFGDILSDEAAEISGSLGLAASINGARPMRWHRRSTVPRPTSPAKASPTRPR